MDPMIERIEKLERCVRYFKWTGGAVVCLGVVALVMGQNPPFAKLPKVFEVDKIVASEVMADKYVLSDSGDLRGIWAVGDEEVLFGMIPPGLKAMAERLNFSPGATRLLASDIVTSGPSLWLGVNIQRASIAMEATEHDSHWELQKDGVVSLTILNKGDTIVGGTWIADPKVGSQIALHDKNGIRRAILGRSSTVTEATGVTHQRPESSLVLFDEKGTVLHQVP